MLRRYLQAADTAAEFDIFASEPWNDTGLYLEAGVTYRLEAQGQWLDKSVPTGPVGGNDGRFHLGEMAHIIGSAIGRIESLVKKYGGNADADLLMTRRHDDMPWFCLVGAIASGEGVDARGQLMHHEYKEIGEGCDWTPAKSGYLYAYANDAWHFYDNNRGRVRLKVSRVG